MSWEAAAPYCGADVRYNVYRGTSPGFTPNAATRIARCVPGTHFDDAVDLTGGTSYVYVVRAEDDAAGHGGPCRDGNEDSNLAEVATAPYGPPVLGTWSDDAGDTGTAKLLAGPAVDHYHQAVAVVVAETFEQARAAAQLLRVNYERTPGRFDLAAEKDKAITPEPGFGGPADSAVGDFASAFRAAPVQLDATYSTPDQSHAMMEPHASIAKWDGDKVTVWTSNQMIAWGVGDMAKTLGLPKENVRLVSPYIGGGFGGKLFLRADALLAALAAREVRRPVKVALHRPLMMNNTTHRPATIQRIRFGATRDGRLTAIAPLGRGRRMRARSARSSFRS